MKIRGLSKTEKEVLTAALAVLQGTSKLSLHRWAAKEMQSMVEDLLWIESKEESLV